MKKLLILAFLLMLSNPANAAVFTVTNASGVPLCDDNSLIEKVFLFIKEYQSQKPVLSIREKRHKSLVLKDLKSFQEVNPRGFNSQNNIIVANKLVTTKINKGLTDKDIRLCQSKNKGNTERMYIMLYLDNNKVVVDILNYAPQTTELSFIY